MGLPGLIGFWPMATVQRSTGNVPNYAPTYTGATKQDLVYNGNPLFSHTVTGVPYIVLDGTGDYLSVADNTDLDVLGTETQYAFPGLTIGAWSFFDNAAPPASSEGIITKDTASAGGRSYSIQRHASSGQGRFGVSVDGTVYTSVDGSVFNASSWYYIVGRYTPSSELAIFVNGVKFTNTTSIPAAIFNSTTAFSIGSFGGSALTTGRQTLCFLSACAIPDTIIQSLFQQTRPLFGV